jgi:hypothetical protein
VLKVQQWVGLELRIDQELRIELRAAIQPQRDAHG